MKYSVILVLVSLPGLLASQDSTDYWKSGYVSYASQYRFTEALHSAENWVRHDSLNPQAWYELAKTCSQKGKRPCTKNALDQLFLLDSTHIGGLNLLAKVQLAAKENDGALGTFERLMEVDSTNPYYTRKAALLAAENKSRSWKALMYFKRTLELDSTDLETYLDYAQFEMERGAFYPADKLIQKALEIDANNEPALIIAARSAHLQDDPEDVIRILKNRTFDQAYFAPAARYYGIAQYKMGAYEDAIETLALLSFALPDADYPHYYSGLSYKAIGDLPAAIKEFELAIEKATSPNLGTYYEQLGQSSQEAGDHKQAIGQLRQAEFLGGNEDVLYHLAISYDAYYADKSMAVKAFQDFLDQDTLAEARSVYALERIEQLKKEAHFNSGK